LKKEKKDNKKTSMNRRQFAKAALGGLGAAAASPLALTEAIAKAEADEKKVQDFRKNCVTTVENPILVDESRYQRFSTANIAFNAYSRDIGESHWAPYGRNLIKNLKQGKGGKDIKVGTFDDARAVNGLEAAMQSGNRLTGNHGEGHENRGPLAWDNHITSADLGSFPKPELPPEEFTKQVKIAARLGGANLVGVCKLDHKWVYESTQRNVYSPDTPETQKIVFRDVDCPQETKDELIIPSKVKYAVVMAVEMPRTLIQSSPGPAAGIGDALGYSRMGWAAIALAEYIRCMGYTAIPCKNDTALSVPLAIEAGIGEPGRMGVIITPEYGPCVRLCKVLTDMPLVPDKPIKFGVEQFCNYCKKCARECPSKCITEGEQTWEPRNECNNGGVKKWYNDYKKCLGFWDENGMSCTNCVAVCPFTKGDMWAHHFTEWSIDNIHASHPIWLTLDDAFGYGQRREDLDVFKRDFAPYGMDPDKMPR